MPTLDAVRRDSSMRDQFVESARERILELRARLSNPNLLTDERERAMRELDWAERDLRDLGVQPQEPFVSSPATAQVAGAGSAQVTGDDPLVALFERGVQHPNYERELKTAHHRLSRNAAHLQGNTPASGVFAKHLAEFDQSIANELSKLQALRAVGVVSKDEERHWKEVLVGRVERRVLDDITAERTASGGSNEAAYDAIDGAIRRRGKVLRGER